MLMHFKYDRQEKFTLFKLFVTKLEQKFSLENVDWYSEKKY